MKDKLTETLRKLQEKAKDSNARMPSIVNIHALLEARGIKHEYSDSTNIVERRSGGHRYVDSRHDGKEGHSIKVLSDDGLRRVLIDMDTYNPYHSWNSWNYARKLLEILGEAQ
ncbi:hypothetical protein MUP79_05495 [Candidatus Bathyarchaeota archaeon]|nr:hypothetical protein [Candidatus Bathyarchaeota archaeon]